MGEGLGDTAQSGSAMHQGVGADSTHVFFIPARIRIYFHTVLDVHTYMPLSNFVY